MVVIAYILGCYSFSHFAMTGALSQEVVSSDGYQLSLSVSTLNHNTLLLAGQQWWPATTHSLLAASSPPPSYSKSNRRLSLLPPRVFAPPFFCLILSVQQLSAVSRLIELETPCIPPQQGTAMSASLSLGSFAPAPCNVQISFQMPLHTPSFLCERKGLRLVSR